MFDQSVGIARTQMLATVAELGLADELAKGPASADELAARLGVNADALHRLMRAMSLAASSSSIAAVASASRARARRCAATTHLSVRDWARYFASRSNSDAWADLTETVRTGSSAFPRVHGRSVWQWFAEHPDEERMFAGGMRAGTLQDAPFIVGGYRWPDEGVLCDVAGGVGTLLAAVLDARPGLRGVLVDAPGVLAEADGWLAGRGLRERVELAEGDIFRSLDAKADVYLMKNILHDWDDEACATILRTLRATMPEGSRLVVVEYLQERNEANLIASLSDIQMMNVCDDGRERSAEEIQALFRGAGLRPGQVVRTGGPGLVGGARLAVGALELHDPLGGGAQARPRRRAEFLGPLRLDLGEDPPPRESGLAAALGQMDDLCAAVVGTRSALEVAKPLELGHRLADCLLREPGPLGQVGQARAVLHVDEAEDAAVALAHVAEAGALHAFEQLADHDVLDPGEQGGDRSLIGEVGHRFVRELDI